MGNLSPNLNETFADRGEEQVSRLLNRLPSVEAPADFAFHVRARIAKGRPAERKSWLQMPVAAAVPLLLLLVVGIYFGFRSVGGTQTAAVPQAAAEQKVMTGQSSPLTVASSELPGSAGPDKSKQPILSTELALTERNGDKSAVSEIKPEIARAEKKIEPKAAVKAPANVNVGGGSFDEAAGKTTVLEANTATSADPKPTATAPQKISALSALGRLGVRLGAGAVVQAGSAFGLKAGDVIEAVNGLALGAASFTAVSEVKSVRVRRDGKSIEVSLR